MLSIKTKAATAGSTCKFTGQVEWKIYRKPCCFSSNRSFLAKLPVNQLWESRHVLCNYLIFIWSSYFISPSYEQQNSNLCAWVKILGTCRLRRPALGLDGVGPAANVPGLHPSSSGTGRSPFEDIWFVAPHRDPGPLEGGPLDGGVGLGGGRVGIISGYPNLNSND